MFTFTGLARIIFTSFLRYNVYSENSAQKHYFEFKKIMKKYRGVQIKIPDTCF